MNPAHLKAVLMPQAMVFPGSRRERFDGVKAQCSEMRQRVMLQRYHYFGGI